MAILPGLAAPLAAVGLTALLDRKRNARRWLVGALAAATGALVALTVAVVLDPDAPQRYLAIRLVVAGLPLALLTAAFTTRRTSANVAVALVAVAVVGEAVFHTGRWYGAHVERARCRRSPPLMPRRHTAGGSSGSRRC